MGSAVFYMNAWIAMFAIGEFTERESLLDRWHTMGSTYKKLRGCLVEGAL